jgi:cellulose synthase/poly-beta-1,6-N-acetylglucosamine synthase-like glycosyltransferase
MAFLGIGLISVVGIVYLLYLFLVLKNRKSLANFNQLLQKSKNSKLNPEPVSIIVSTYNEATVIGRKLENITNLDYPLNKIEVLVVDDCSTDGTGEIARKKMDELKISGRIIKTPNRLGLNRSLNLAMKEAKNNLVVITDSDVVLEENSLKNAVKVLENCENAGGVTGKINPWFEGEGIAQSNESLYRNFYDQSMLGESALHSAFPGNGPLIVFDKSQVPFEIPEDYGSTDGNIAINIIKSGLRFIYVPDAIILEPVPENIGQQRLQKVRRAKRLIQVFLHNLDIFRNDKYGSFGKTVFPLKLLMLTLCPVLFFFGIGFFAVGVLLAQNFGLYVLSGVIVASLAVLLVFSKNIGGQISSFVFHQVYLLVGLLSSVRKSVYWKTIDRK